MEWLFEALRAARQFVSVNSPTAFAALFGTFFGAWFAFLFERKHQKTLALHADLAAGRQAQFALILQLNRTKNIWKQSLAPREKDEQRAFTLIPFLVLTDYPKVPFSGLGYFLEDGEGANILGETMVAEERFSTFVHAVEQRNLRHENMQRVTARPAPENVIDAANRAILKDLTDSLYELADAILKDHEASVKTIHGYLKKRFPKHRALGIA